MISVVILVKNEERNIRDCLASLSFCDEIIIVNDNSQDDSPSVARRLGAKVFDHALDDNFAQARNFGLSKAKGDWVLFIDADERVSAELAQEITEAVNERADYSGFYLKRTDIFLGRRLKHGETDICLLRLARRDAGFWLRPVHEYWQVTGKTAVLTAPLYHYAHTSLADLFVKINFYARIHAKALAAEGKESSLARIIFYPPAKFISNWILKRGFLDGVPGLIMAMSMSLHSFLASAHLYLLTRKR